MTEIPSLPIPANKGQPKSGILSSRQLDNLIGSQITLARPLLDGQVQPASLDLRLGFEAYSIPASFLPGKSRTVAQRLKDWSSERIDLSQGAVLKKGHVYIVPLMEGLALRQALCGLANPKSSTGRLDVFTRLITDYATQFDRVERDYQGPLYAEIAPRSFDIVVYPHTRLLQLRLQQGDLIPDNVVLEKLHQSFELVKEEGDPDIKDGGIAVRVDLKGCGNERLIAYEAKSDCAEAIDIEKIDHYGIDDFWIRHFAGERAELVLEPDRFYILASKNPLWVPPGFAGEMVAYDTLVGEFRVHYAGFFDPGFGDHRPLSTGTKAVLEVRSHEVPFLIEDGQIMGRIIYHNLLEEPDQIYGASISSNYGRQGLTLAKQFKKMEVQG